ncbi:hypothetical protein IAE22_31610, partial [Bacillus sp. S34]|nr:hypothetical protein [Bacillus sp. S34]
LTSETITDAGALRADVERTREQGFTLSLDDATIEAAIRQVFDLRPAAIIRDLDLLRDLARWAERELAAGADEDRLRSVLAGLGGGSAGYTTVKQLQKHAATVPMRITLVDQNTYYTYLPFLPEVAGGHIAPKDVTVELRRAL